MTTIDISKAPFGTVVGGVGAFADARLMVIGPNGDPYGGTTCVLLTGEPEEVGSSMSYSGLGWIVYSEEE